MLPSKKSLNILAIYNEKLVFNTDVSSNDLQGSLAANIKFAQSQIIPATVKKGDRQPHLIGNRKTLLLVKPLEILDRLQVTVVNRENEVLGSLQLARPEQLPSTAYQIDNVPDDIDFNPLPGSTTIINSSAQLAQLSEPDASFLKEQLRENSLVEIQTADGRWARNIYLPEGTELENKVIRFRSNAGYTSTVIYSGRNATISRGETWLFKYLAGQWVRDGELENQGLVYALNTWSVELPASWIKPGIALHFASGNLSGKLENIRVGAPTELLIHTIDIGMLTAPRNQFLFAQDPEAHREYFQTAPISRMIVSNYQSLHLTEVMLPDGQLLTDFDPSQGGVHSGTMRQRIGKELISLGINHANYGINCSEGEGEWTPYLAGQLTAHNSVGKYANGTVIHGLSGGAGMVTLENSLGNEFSHEVGHNYDLVHYPGDFDGSVHQSADSINSTWGWDMDRRKFLPNFKPSITNKPSCYEGVCQATFHGRSFGFDPMASGEPMAPINRFTLHTPYTASQAQEFMEKKVVFSADSATGFRKWDNNTQRMEPYFHRIDTVSGVTASNTDLSANALAALFRTSKLVNVTMADGNWAKDINLPLASAENKDTIFTLRHQATYNSTLFINGTSIEINRGFSKNFYSNGDTWQECLIINSHTTRAIASNDHLSHAFLTDLLSRFTLTQIILNDGDWVQSMEVPPASPQNNQRLISVENNALEESVIYINGLSLKLLPGHKKVYISDGERWLEDQVVVDISKAVKPNQFGVPVTTLIGYYDPQGILPDYIYPALHGAYGFIYNDDSDDVTDADCQLWIESAEGLQRFKLENSRIRSNVMNKFHINIAQSEQPQTVTIMRDGKAVCRRTIEPASTSLTWTVNGESDNAALPSPVEPSTAPGNLRSTAVTASSISLAWDASATRGTLESYSIFRSENGGVTSVIASVPASQLSWNDTGLKADTRYSYFAVAYDVEGRMSPKSNTLAVNTDALPVTAPTAPGNLRSTAVTASSISLAWDAAVTRGTLESYSIFRSENGGVTSVIASVPASQLTYSDNGLKADTRYSYFAVAYDVEGRMSPKSNTLAVNTDALPVTAPTAPGNLRSTAVTAGSISLAWDASATRGTLESYSIFRSENGGVTSVIASVPASQLTYSDTGLKADTRYSYFAVAYDVEGRMSPKSNTLSVNTDALPVTAPTAPGNLRSTAVTAGSISLAWDASATRGTLESYSIFRSENGGVTSVIASVPASQLSWNDTGLKADTRYSYFAVAYDVEGRMSPKSNTLSVNTDALPVTAPTAPGNLRSTAVTAGSISLAWDAAATRGTLESYSLFRQGEGEAVASVVASVPASQLSWNDTGLKADTRYSYFAVAYDVEGRMSPKSNTLSVNTDALPVTAPTAPGNLRSTAVTAGSISLAWDASATRGTLESYSIFRQGEGEAVASVIASVPASQLTYSDNGLKADTRYSYFAVAYDVEGRMSPKSNALSVATLASAGIREWALDETYVAGEEVVWQNKRWICLQTHTAWVAEWAPGGSDSATLWRAA